MNSKSVPALDAATAQQLFDDTIQRFIQPEILARHERNEIGVPLDLIKAQVLFFLDGRPTVVRLNDEVRALAQFYVLPKTDKVIGSKIYEEEVAGIESVQLHGDDENCGHITIIRLKDHYHLTFDATYNRGRARELIETATEFLRAAEFCRTKEYWAAFVDNLFSAMELAVKALLWTNAEFGGQFRAKMKHSTLHSLFNRFAKLGNVPEGQRATFNTLATTRPKARYRRAASQKDWEQSDTWLAHVQQLVARTERIIAQPLNALSP